MPSERWCGVVTLCSWSSHLVTAEYPHHHDSCVRSHCVLLIHASLLATLSPEYDGYCGGFLELEQEEVRIKDCRFDPGHVQSVVNVANPSHV